MSYALFALYLSSYLLETDNKIPDITSNVDFKLSFYNSRVVPDEVLARAKVQRNLFKKKINNIS